MYSAKLLLNKWYLKRSNHNFPCTLYWESADLAIYTLIIELIFNGIINLYDQQLTIDKKLNKNKGSMKNLGDKMGLLNLIAEKWHK